MKQQFIIINGIRVAYIKNITDPTKPIHVFLHGWMSNKESFARLYKYIENYICFDFPGMGASANLSEAWDIKDFAFFTSEFFKRICTEEGSYHLLVHSFGGRILLKILSEGYSHPQWESITLTGVPFYPSKDYKTKLIKIGNSIFFYPPFSYFRSLGKVLYQKIFSTEDYASLGDNKILKETFKNIVNHNISQYIPLLIPYPHIKLIWGEKDGSAPLSLAEKANKKLSMSSLYTIKNANHFPWIEQEKEFIRYWLS